MKWLEMYLVDSQILTFSYSHSNRWTFILNQLDEHVHGDDNEDDNDDCDDVTRRVMAVVVVVRVISVLLIGT